MTTAVAALVTVVAVFVPFLLVNADAVKLAYRSWWNSGASYGSLWLLPLSLPSDPKPRWTTRLGLDADPAGPGHRHHAGAARAVVLAVGVGFLMTLGAERRPRVAQVAFVVLAIVVITGKSWPVQASLWLLPLAALARPRWRDHLIWVGCEATYFMGVWLYLAGADHGQPRAARVLVLPARRRPGRRLLWLVAMVVRDARPSGAGRRPAGRGRRPAGRPVRRRGRRRRRPASVTIRRPTRRRRRLDEDEPDREGPVDDDSPAAPPSRYP